VGGKYFDNYGPPKFCVERFIDLALPANAELGHDAVVKQVLPDHSSTRDAELSLKSRGYRIVVTLLLKIRKQL
jgi:hypothetical protein